MNLQADRGVPAGEGNPEEGRAGGGPEIRRSWGCSPWRRTDWPSSLGPERSRGRTDCSQAQPGQVVSSPSQWAGDTEESPPLLALAVGGPAPTLPPSRLT